MTDILGCCGTSQGNGAAIELEIWEVDEIGLMRILKHEPPGLTLGRVVLADSAEVLGVLAEPYLVEGMLEITTTGLAKYSLNRRPARFELRTV